MENNTLKKGLENLSEAQTEMKQIVDNYFRTGGYENQMDLISSALQDIVNKGSGEDTTSLDNEFEYTNRYIRASVYELTELQKFMTHLRESYLRYRRSCDYLKNTASQKQQTPVMQKQTN